MKVLLISNGHGEDTVGSVLAAELAALGAQIAAVPLVGKGMAYERAGFEVLGPRLELPSGGFVQQPGALWSDIKAGLLGMTLQQWRAVRRASASASATLVVGDYYAMLVGSLLAKHPVFQMQSLISVRNWEGGAARGEPFGILERFLMRRATGVFPRDRESTEWLVNRGVKATYLGNPMLDAVSGEALVDVPRPYLLLLPGSRTDAYESLPLMLEACRGLPEMGLTPVVAWAGLPLESLKLSQWVLESTGASAGITHRLIHPDGTGVWISQRAFKSVLTGAKLAISTAGAASEQAAGYGVPVVGFPTSGPQFTLSFAQNFKRLLREAMVLTKADPHPIAHSVRVLLSDQARYHQAQQAGYTLMGQPGSAQRIASYIWQSLHGASRVSI